MWRAVRPDQLELVRRRIAERVAHAGGMREGSGVRLAITADTEMMVELLAALESVTHARDELREVVAAMQRDREVVIEALRAKAAEALASKPARGKAPKAPVDGPAPGMPRWTCARCGRVTAAFERPTEWLSASDCGCGGEG